ncbi:hypothetical protein QBC44DRAFT_2342 [Cladorrhinum sp. PSN332]|nr:hypothetical protein QBC44DRAFT_2342 [Cladorrhinum sp. PSN332]
MTMGLLDKPIVCGDGYTCTTDTSRKRIGCCAMTGPSSDCVLGNACYDFDGAASCKDNNNCSPAMLCTETATPYCNTYSFEDNSFTDFFCHTAALGVQKGRTNFITPSGLSKDQKIAVGVGVGVGAPTLSFFIALIFFPRFRKRTKQVFTGDFSFQVIWGGDVVHGDKFTGNKQMGDLVVGDKRVAGSGEASGSKPAETPSPSVQVLTQSVPQEGTTNKIPRGLGWLEGLGKGKNTKGAAG